MRHERPVCPECGSDEIRKDAFAAWDDAAQGWELDSTYDNCICQECGWQGDVPKWEKCHPDHEECLCD